MARGGWWLTTSVLLLLAVPALSQTPTKIRSVSSLPSTCTGGVPLAQSDEVVLVTAGSGVVYICSAPNTWTPVGSGGAGNPGGLNTQLQFNNSGIFGGILNQTAGYSMVSQGGAASTTPAFQLKGQVDPRDYGAFGNNASHTIIQSDITNNTQWLGCGTATSTGTTLTWNTGAKFYPTMDPAISTGSANINFNGADFTVASVGATTAGVATTLTLGSSAGNVGPARWCMYSTGDQWDYVALQESIFVALGAPGSEHSDSGAWQNREIMIPGGSYFINKTLNITHGAGVHIWGAQRFGVFIYQRTSTTPILQTNGFSYSKVEGIFFRPSAGTNGGANTALIEESWDGTSTSWGQALQGNSWEDNVFSAENLPWPIGIRLGGAGFMGSEHIFKNNHWLWFTTACYVSSNFNALQNTFIGGNFQNCSGDGIRVSSGSVMVYSVGFQNGTQISTPAQTGYDINVQASANDVFIVRDSRSESQRFFQSSAPGVRIDIRGNHQLVTSNFWQSGHLYSANQIVRQPTNSTKGIGGAFYVSTPGTSAGAEPTWTYTTTADNTVVWTYLPVVFVNAASAPGVIEDNAVDMGSIISAGGNTYELRIANNSFGHTDWLNPNGTSPYARQNGILNTCNNTVWQGGGPDNGGGPIAYSTSSNVASTTQIKALSYCEFSNMPLIWSTIKSAGVMNDDAGIGHMANSLSTTGSGAAPQDTGVAIIGSSAGINPAFTRVDANGADQAGIEQRISGGRSTGAGLGGAVTIETASAAASSSTLNALVKRWQVPSTGHLLAFADNTYDIGAAGANRPRNLYVAGTTTSGTFSSSGLFGESETYNESPCETAGAPTTLNVGGTTTDTGLTCLPATAVIDSVVYRITTTITTAASFQIGDATTAGRFCGAQVVLTAGTTGVCFVQADQTGAAGPRQTSAVAVRVTTNANPGAGAIRLIVFYHTWTAPTS